MISIIISVVAVCVTAAAGYIAYRTRQADHERSRRQETLNVMKFWHERYYQDEMVFLLVRRILDVLAPNDCAHIESMRALSLDRKHRDLFALFFKQKGLPHQFTTSTEDSFTVTEDQVNVLRAYILKYLNLLEIVAAGYYYGVTDRKMMEFEFRSVLFRNDHYLCGPYISETRRYPSLKAIEHDFRQAAREENPKKSEIR